MVRALQSLLDKAEILLRQGKVREARDLSADALSQSPEDPRALMLAGLAEAQAGNLDTALDHLDRLVAVAPRSAEAHFHRANLLRHSGRTGDAIGAYRMSVSLAPGAPGPLTNLGALLLVSGDPAAALPVTRESVRVAPSVSAAWGNLAGALIECGETNEGLEAARKALSLDQRNTEAYLALAKGLSLQQCRQEARQAFETALRIDPDCRPALVGLSALLDRQTEMPRAVQLLERAVALDESDVGALATYVALLQATCDWSRFKESAARLDTLPLGTGGIPAESPMLSVSRSENPARNFAVARSWSEQIAGRVAGCETFVHGDRERSPSDQIRIGYLSCDFHDHATGHLMRSLFEAHDRSGFVICAYSYGPDDASDYRRKIERDCDRFVDIRTCSAAEAARRIYEDRIDVLIDIKGFTRDNRLEICACRPAPVQVAYLAFPGTSGAAFFDYIITDKVVSPAEHSGFYSEKFAYLPHTYQINDHHQQISENPTARSAWGLPEEGTVFCSFNQTYKIDSEMFSVWMGLLNAVPGSVLWLLQDNPVAEANLRQAVSSQGLDPNRLLFAGKVSKPEHLERLRHADLVLDTRIYNGHTTTSDALWAGIPVVTLCGKHFASRVSASLLKAIGLEELIAETAADYRCMALDLVSDPKKLESVKARIWKARRTAPLFDTKGTVRALECAYRAMWNRYLSGAPPEAFSVPDPKSPPAT